MGLSMRKFVLIAVAIVSALSVAGCAGKGKSPIGKGKAPVVQTRG
jgi:outer membrane murein-binding lipoprotein Lpp